MYVEIRMCGCEACDHRDGLGFCFGHGAFVIRDRAGFHGIMFWTRRRSGFLHTLEQRNELTNVMERAFVRFCVINVGVGIDASVSSDEHFGIVGARLFFITFSVPMWAGSA